MSVTIFFLKFCLSLCSAYVNLALYKPAFEQNVWGFSHHNARKVVDGQKFNLSFSSRECFESGHGYNFSIWFVNLTSIYSIRKIRIYYPTDNKNIVGYHLGFSIYVSNTSNMLDGTMCYKDTDFTVSTFPPDFTTTCHVHGQYVIYYNERLPGVTYPPNYSLTVYNDLCEVEVYGCPVPGYNGADCNISCSDADCCVSHIETGTCQGCYNGYKKDQCEWAKEQKGCEGVQSEGISWTTTLAGITNEESCPENLTGIATRFCDQRGIWESPNLINCTNEALVNASLLLDNIIANETQGRFSIQETVNNTLQLMKHLTSSTNEISAGDLSSSLDILGKIVTVTNATGSVIEKEVFYAVIDNILSPNYSNSWTNVSEKTEKDPSFLLKNMDRFSKITLQNDNITATKFIGSNFELVINQTKIDETEIRFPDEQLNNVSQHSEHSPTFLELPKQTSNATKAINYVAVLYKTMSDILGSDPNR